MGLGIPGGEDDEEAEAEAEVDHGVAAAAAAAAGGTRRLTPLSYAQALAGSGRRVAATLAPALAPEATRAAPPAATATTATTSSSSPPLSAAAAAFELEADRLTALAALWEEEAPEPAPRHPSAASSYGRGGRPPAWLLPRPPAVDGHSSTSSSTSGLSAGARPFYPSSSGNSPYLHSSEPPVRACMCPRIRVCLRRHKTAPVCAP